MRQLLIGSGNSRARNIRPTRTDAGFEELTTLDVDPRCHPDVLWDLNVVPLPFEDSAFDEIHAYEVLEHIGRQGDWRGFFAEFSEYWRILAPNGYLVGSCPAYGDAWVWGDPGHTRLISPQSFTFLDQSEYSKQIGKGSMTDYRVVYQADFNLAMQQQKDGVLYFALQAVKPSRHETL